MLLFFFILFKNIHSIVVSKDTCIPDTANKWLIPFSWYEVFTWLFINELSPKIKVLKYGSTGAQVKKL